MLSLSGLHRWAKIEPSPVFSLPANRVCHLSPTTNPNPSQFYTVTCPLSPDKIEFIANDGEIYFGTNGYGATYYLDYSTLTVTASLAAKYTLTVNASNAQGVSISSSTAHGGTTDYSMSVSQGVGVNLEAPQYHGSGATRKRFTAWSGAVSSTDRSITFNMNGNMILTAGYVDDPPCTITVYASPASGGTVTGGGEYNSGDTASLKATPNAGYAFLNWTEGGRVVSTATTYAFTVTLDRTLVANFVEAKPVPVTPWLLQLLLD